MIYVLLLLNEFFNKLTKKMPRGKASIKIRIILFTVIVFIHIIIFINDVTNSVIH